MPISNFFIPKLLNYFRRETDYDEDDIDMIRYSLQAILWETEKIIYLSIIFILLGLGWQYLIALVAMVSVRVFAGGFHASTSWRCFAWTLFGFSLALLVLSRIPLVSVTVMIVGVFSLVTTFLATPTRSEQMRAIADTSKDGQKRLIAVLITMGWFVLLFLNQSHFLAPAVLWILFMQNLQLLIEYSRQKYEKAALAKSS